MTNRAPSTRTNRAQVDWGDGMTADLPAIDFTGLPMPRGPWVRGEMVTVEELPGPSRVMMDPDLDDDPGRPPCPDEATYLAHRSDHYRQAAGWGCRSCEAAS